MYDVSSNVADELLMPPNHKKSSYPRSHVSFTVVQYRSGSIRMCEQ